MAIIGAGRWARELARTIRGLGESVCMHSPSHAGDLRAALVALPELADLPVTSSLDELAAQRPRGVIVANAARDHARAIEWALDACVPTLVEKPFTVSLEDTRRLVRRARHDGTPLFAAHVMMFAGYLVALARLLRGHRLTGLQIEWRDPAQEVRYGERKRFDAGVPVYVDCLPHIASVLALLCPAASVSGRSLQVERGGARVLLQLRVGEIDCEVALERNAPARVRKVVASGAVFAQLDFTREPGELRVDDVVGNADPEWQSRPRPMAAMLEAFIEAARGGEPDARLDAGIAMCAAELIDWATPIYTLQRSQWLAGALLARSAEDAELEYALAEILQSRGPMSTDSLARYVRRVQEHFRANPDPAWLAMLAGAKDPVSIVDVSGAAVLRGLS
jgi:predicted dehydrogenase